MCWFYSPLLTPFWNDDIGVYSAQTGSRRHCTLKSHFLLVNFYFVLVQFQIKRDLF